MRRLLSLLLILSLLVSAAALFSGCEKETVSKDYPVEIGGVTIKEEPQNIVVLSDNLADIISYIGYDVKMVGKSIDCDQDFLTVVPTVGTADNPSIDSITDHEADLVIADSRLSEKSKEKLENEGITVVTMVKAESFDELKTLYQNLGTVLGGNVTGKQKGEEAYEELIDTLSSFKATVSGNIVKTAAYLYIDQDGMLCTFTKDSIEAKIFSYNSALNIFSNQEEPAVVSTELKMGTPTYIFYDDETVLSYLEHDEALSTLSALTAGRTCQIPLSDFSRQGVTYEDTVFNMINVMFVQSETEPATPDEVIAGEEGAPVLDEPVADAADEEAVVSE